MLLKLTVHAQIRLQERGFSIDALKKTVREPDKTEHLEEGSIKASKNLGNGTILEVVYKKDSFRDRKDHYIIVTAYFIEDIKK